MLSRTSVFALVAGLAAAATAMRLCRDGSAPAGPPAGPVVVVPGARAAAANSQPAPIQADATIESQQSGLPPELFRRYPPGSRIPMQVSRTDHGVRCPDGSFLPLLNGVPDAPAIVRGAYLGPLPPVVAKIVDDTGTEWYEHADGSTTTTRFRTVIMDGKPVPNIETLHNGRLPPGAGRTRPASGQ